jgi:hypothetical protein
MKTMPPLAIPPLAGLAVMGAALVGRWAVREIRRVNAELDVLKAAKAKAPVDRSQLRTLRRDPESGVYRPE